MAKTVSESKFTEWAGLDRIQHVVHAMKCIWRETSKDDYGIDGEIEVVTQKTDGPGYETKGGIIKVQAKSGRKYVVSDTADTFAAPVERGDLELWHGATFPTLFVVYHPQDDKLYAKEVKQYLRNAPEAFKPPHRIKFDKSTDEFNIQYFDSIVEYSGGSPPRIRFDEQERIFTNLLSVIHLPKVYQSRATIAEAHDVFRECEGSTPPFSIRGESFYTLDDLLDRGSPLRRFTMGRVTKTAGKEALLSDIMHDDYVFMLKQLLRSHLYQRGVSYNKHFRRFYFRRQNNDDLEVRRDWVSFRTGKKAPARTLVKFYEYGRHRTIRFWRHLAASISYVEINDEVFLQIVPKYLFTEDGHTPCEPDLVGPYTTRLKADEHNANVLNHVLFWTWYMADGKKQISMRQGERVLLTATSEPLTTVAELALPLDPALYEEPAQALQQPLLFMDPDDEFEEHIDAD